MGEALLRVEEEPLRHRREVEIGGLREEPQRRLRRMRLPRRGRTLGDDRDGSLARLAPGRTRLVSARYSSCASFCSPATPARRTSARKRPRMSGSRARAGVCPGAVQPSSWTPSGSLMGLGDFVRSSGSSTSAPERPERKHRLAHPSDVGENHARLRCPVRVHEGSLSDERLCSDRTTSASRSAGRNSMRPRSLTTGIAPSRISRKDRWTGDTEQSQASWTLRRASGYRGSLVVSVTLGACLTGSGGRGRSRKIPSTGRASRA